MRTTGCSRSWACAPCKGPEASNTPVFGELDFRMKLKKIAAIASFVLMLLVWIATITHDTLGFIIPNSAQATGFDIWGALVWFAFLYSTLNLWRVFKRTTKEY
jgi:amino acid permease